MLIRAGYMNDSLKLRSKIKAPLLRASLLRGSVLAILGIVAIIYAGAYLSPKEFENWGWLVFLPAIVCVAVGLVPYRRLNALQTNPDLLVVTEHNLQFSSRGKLLFTLPITDIADLFYVDDSTDYGIAITLKQSLPEKICIHHPSYDAEKARKSCRREHGCDLFLKYFTEGAFEQVESVVHPEEDED